MNWGVKITLAFIVFAIIMITMVVISINQDVNLVAHDYYKQEIAYESQIERIKNAKNLDFPPSIDFDKEVNSVVITFPVSLGNQIKAGTVLLYRPSDQRKDVKAKLALDHNNQFKISMTDRKKGNWLIKLTWSDSQKEYYYEKQFVY